MIVTAIYSRPVGEFDETRAIELEAECFADCDDGTPIIIWTDWTLEKLARLNFDSEELVGATEAVESAFDCHRVRIAQQTGDQAFFDARSSKQESTAAE